MHGQESGNLGVDFLIANWGTLESGEVPQIPMDFERVLQKSFKLGNLPWNNLKYYHSTYLRFEGNLQTGELLLKLLLLCFSA